MNPHASTTLHLCITGPVQGVGYRWNMAQEARRLGVKGWVRNRLDGSVEAVVCGPVQAVEAVLGWAQVGPVGARVDEVVISEAEGVFVGLQQHETI